MKIKKLLALGLATLALTMTACGKKGGDEEQAVDIKGEYEILVWCGEGTKDLTAEYIRKFEAANEGVTFKETIEEVSEANAGTQMLTDIDAGADIYSFAQDQTARLIQGGALAKLGKGAAKNVTEQNDEGSVKAVTSGSDLYAYPMTSDNGYFMYYDKSVIGDTDITDLDALVTKCEQAGRNISYEFGSSGWYEVAPFFGNGCVSEWTTNSKGKFVSVKDTFNSEAGLAAAKAIQHMVQSTTHVDSSSAADFTAGTKSAIVISGTWNYENAKTALGDNLGIAELPSMNIGGKKVHLGSFAGYKLIGVKPQSDAKKAAACQKLAQFLTNKEAQLARFELKGWGPSNKEAQQDPAVQASPALKALKAQNEYSQVQGQIHGSWWDIMKALATAIKAAKTDAELQAALTVYDTAVKACVAENTSPWGLVGSFAASGWSTNVDFAQQDDGTWVLDYTLAADDEFKVRKGTDWDTFNDLQLTLPEGKIEQKADGNLKCLVAGEYHFVVDGEAGTLVITAK